MMTSTRPVAFTCAVALLGAAFASEAAPRVVRLTPPSDLFTSGTRAADGGVMVARFLPGQKADLQATVVPDPGQPLVEVQFSVNGQPVTSGVTERSEIGLVKELPRGTLVTSVRGWSAPQRAGDYTLTVTARQADGQSVTATGEFRVEPLEGRGRKVRNVIFLLGDGMGMAHRSAARLVLGRLSQGKLHRGLAMDFPNVALVRTASLDAMVTDSAPGMASYFTGNKHANGTEGVFPDDTLDPFDNPRVEYLPAYLHRTAGKRLGVVTTADVSDATPAATAVHTDNRRAGTGIVDQFLDERSRSGLTVLLGGGRKWFLPNTVPGSGRNAQGDSVLSLAQATAWGVPAGVRDPGRDLIADFQAAGFRYVSTGAELAAATPDGGPLLGLFAYSNMNVALDKIGGRRGTSTVVADYGLPDQPMLDEMAAKALDVLSTAPQGFVLLIEGASIDKQSHAMDSERWLLEVLEFDRAVAVARRYAEEHPDTLIVVTADHETAGTSLIGGSRVSAAELARRAAAGGGKGPLRDEVVGIYEDGGMPQYRLAPDGYPETMEVDGKLLVGYGANADRYEDWVTNARPLADVGAPGLPSGAAQGPARPDQRDLAGELFYLGQVPGVSSAHTATDIPLTAGGLGGALFGGSLDNTDVFFRIARGVLKGTK